MRKPILGAILGAAPGIYWEATKKGVISARILGAFLWNLE